MKIINYKKILINYFSLLFLISLFSLVLEAQEYKDGLIDVDVELVLAVDVSYSVYQNEFYIHTQMLLLLEPLLQLLLLLLLPLLRPP